MEIKVDSLEMKKELAEVRALIKENGRLTKQAIIEIRNMSFNLDDKIEGLSKKLKELRHQMSMLIETCKQISDEQKKIYSGKDMYKMFKVEGMTQAQIAKRCDCSVSTVKRHINNYKNSMFDMEV